MQRCTQTNTRMQAFPGYQEACGFTPVGYGRLLTDSAPASTSKHLIDVCQVLAHTQPLQGCC
jgi:hypothetical protein